MSERLLQSIRGFSRSHGYSQGPTNADQKKIKTLGKKLLAAQTKKAKIKTAKKVSMKALIKATEEITKLRNAIRKLS